ncbi:glycosyltransferase family 2 protein, partial [Enterococcus faecium]|nr:glycosyltransferase family 2 protein [Enterococcus faecium]
MISIVIPFYNAENTLERCIKSILQQTYYNIEIILVDNNSNDESKRICKSIS